METPLYIIAIVPEQPTRIRDFFDSTPGHASEFLEKPGEFRLAGWDLNTRDQARIVNAEYLEVTNGDRKAIQLYEDGTLLVKGAIDTDFLGWASRDFSTNPQIHTLAIVEFTSAVAYLYQRLLTLLEQPPARLTFRLEIKNAKVGDKFIYLIPYALNTYGALFRSDGMSATTENPSTTGTLDVAILREDPSRAAFKLVERLFLLFGVSPDKVPYAEDTEAGRRIAIEKIQKTQ